jgi:hypothetical protein
MRALVRFTLPVLLVAVAAIAPAADDPVQLLKAVTPGTGSVRVQIPVATTGMFTDSQLKGQVPKAKGKKTDVVDVTIAFDTLPGKSNVSAKKWQSWGYEIPANRIGVLPELIIPATQLAPKVSKGRDVEVRIPSVSLEIIDPPAGSDQVFGSDLYIRINDLTKNADRAFEPRYYFGDKTLELTVPSTAIKKLGTGDEPPAEPGVDPDKSLVIVSGPMNASRGTPGFAFASINGLPQYKTPDGKTEMVNVGVSSNTNWPGGIIMTIGVARGCGVEIDKDAKDLTGTGTTFETMIAKGKVKEFRLGFMTGPGFKAQKDFVLKDVTVYVDKNNSGHFVWLGTKFFNEYIKDGIYSCGSDGAFKTLGRIQPEFLLDIKTRMPPPKK